MIGDLFDSPWKILIVALVIIVLFGSAKLPVAARSLGRSMRILKSEVQGMHDDEAQAQPAPFTQHEIPASPAVAASQPVAAPQPIAAEQPLTAQQQIDSLQQQIRDLKDSPARQTASVPSDQQPS